MNIVTIEYNASVLVAAGWRSIDIKAKAEKISEKMAGVTEVTAVDGEESFGFTSRTGAKRQQYNSAYIAEREIGKKKRLSACTVVE